MYEVKFLNAGVQQLHKAELKDIEYYIKTVGGFTIVP